MNTTNKRGGLLMTSLTMLALIGIGGSVYAQTTTCATSFTPSCGYILPNGTYYYTATEITLTSGKVIPPGYFYNPLTGDYFRVGAPGAGGSTTTPNLGLGAGSGSASGVTHPNATTTTTNPNAQAVNNPNNHINFNDTWRPRTVANENVVSVSTTTTVTTLDSSPGAPDAGGGQGGGSGTPGVPNSGLGGELGMTLFNLLSSGVLAAGAATYIIRNSINYKL